MRVIALLPLFLAHAAVALPEFNGARADDIPTPIFRNAAEAKNRNVGIRDIGDVMLQREEMLIRIYADSGVLMRGGHSMDLRELYVHDDVLALRWSPRCPGAPVLSSSAPDEAWQVIQDQDLFTIRDSRAYEDYPRVYDGIAYFIQIRTADAYREFLVSNPQLYEAGDNPRLMKIIDAVAAELEAVPSCLER